MHHKTKSTDPLRMVRLSAASCIVEKITGDKPNPSTLYRWHSRGLKGVKLRTAYAGGHRRTTEQWIREFFDAVTEAADGQVDESQYQASSPMAPPSRGSNATDAELDAAGI